jgi:hypothetical protein
MVKAPAFADSEFGEEPNEASGENGVISKLAMLPNVTLSARLRRQRSWYRSITKHGRRWVDDR